VRQAAETGIVGGAVYDALLAHCALKSHAQTIFTWNVKHFQQMGPEIAHRAAGWRRHRCLYRGWRRHCLLCLRPSAY
jgi:hypothetical protein